MASNKSLDRQAPAFVQASLDKFCATMQSALGDQAIWIVLYGRFAEEDFVPQNIAVNVVVVVKDISVELLDRAAAPVQVGGRQCGLSVLFLSEDELRRSTDVFPIKSLEMQRRHRLLQGRDVLSGLSISHEHLRLPCEQENKNLMLRIHRSYLQKAPCFERIEKILIRGGSAFVVSLRVLVRLFRHVVKRAIREIEDGRPLSRVAYLPSVGIWFGIRPLARLRFVVFPPFLGLSSCASKLNHLT